MLGATESNAVAHESREHLICLRQEISSFWGLIGILVLDSSNYNIHLWMLDWLTIICYLNELIRYDLAVHNPDRINE